MPAKIFHLSKPAPNNADYLYFKVGVPSPKGLWQPNDPIGICGPDGLLENASVEAQLLWPDGSVRWFLSEGYVAACDLIESAPFSLEKIPATMPVIDPNIIRSDAKTLDITLQSGHKVSISRHELLAFKLNNTACTLLVNNDSEAINTLDSMHYSIKRHAVTPHAVSVYQQGSIQLGGLVLQIRVELSVNLRLGDIQLTATLINPQRAEHANGQWDLGDPNSIYLQEIALRIDQAASSLSLSANRDVMDVSGFPDFHLHQASSGKANWQSRVHADASGQVALPFKGYRFSANQDILDSGEQTQPHITLKTPEYQVNLEVEQFWQHFPAAITQQDNTLAISLMGARGSPVTELQPGEQKTRKLRLSLSGKIQTAEISLDPAFVRATGALDLFHPASAQQPLSALIQRGVEGADSFFHKRDQLDEYGWRHFGELYADHECALTPDQDYFVSHYNNQYDPVQGMLSQWLLTGNADWFTLGDDLARHVADIDVYHSKFDKPEYAGGLFWHTDHYVEAYTATHRTYSRHQPSNVYDDHAGGGGPGGQHCYTSGLLLHYLLTGNQTSKEACLSLCQWIENYYEGDGSLNGLLLAIKNSGIADLKNIRTGQYPLDRGTGNYLNALMDRFTLLARQRDLDQCAHIIYNTARDTDDLAARDLLNTEKHWFYTVFLQAVCRYILLKEQLSQNDASYAQAVCTLKHYALWMARHEYAYLDQPEKLEFPNQTWSGQDLRKLCVLAFAANYLTAEQQELVANKLAELKPVIEQRLMASVESQTTRVLCLMMQNIHIDAYANLPSPMALKANYSPHKALTTPPLRKRIWQALRGLSLRYERQQLVRRFPPLQKWLGQP